MTFGWYGMSILNALGNEKINSAKYANSNHTIPYTHFTSMIVCLAIMSSANPASR